ncbi:MAG: crotonase/enoyl-CoA hydratase family protein [Alphaproteobacteria bacterium]|nr:crotonase/enoyl-CoA hydratase family protein [Alphaproteobacteria bacterium]
MTALVMAETNGPVRIITINRPQARNAVDRPTADELCAAFLAFERDESALVAVLTGAGGAFCAGADLKGVAEGRGNRIADPATGEAFNPLADDGPMGPSRMLLSKPVIAAIAGPAVAGGLELALWCDLRVMEEGAVMGVYCRRWGVPLIDGGTVRLPRLIGMSRALDLILTGRPVDAAEALSMGLANRVVPKGEARAAAEALALEIARFPQGCLRRDRLSAYRQWDLAYDAAMAEEFRLGKETLMSGESLAGAARFASGKGRGGDFKDF